MSRPDRGSTGSQRQSGMGASSDRSAWVTAFPGAQQRQPPARRPVLRLSDDARRELKYAAGVAVCTVAVSSIKSRVQRLPLVGGLIHGVLGEAAAGRRRRLLRSLNRSRVPSRARDPPSRDRSADLVPTLLLGPAIGVAMVLLLDDRERARARHVALPQAKRKVRELKVRTTCKT